jgi:hypothetical protein
MVSICDVNDRSREAAGGINRHTVLRLLSLVEPRMRLLAPTS